MTIIAGCLSFWIIQDFPETATFVTEAERKFVMQKLKDDGQFNISGEVFSIRYIWDSWKDWKTWVSSKWFLCYQLLGYDIMANGSDISSRIVSRQNLWN